ncbi:hypothetical protein [Streptomyces sp. NBC_01320]|uniref:hypothetical protein n=1 Tax=Streptomyces sp. NBC_01320 TaxID=2903824 RepID=UPI002E10CA2F|nr:hypothetical protein OG395_57015 [Streptomyces sp. NBC_01320]
MAQARKHAADQLAAWNLNDLTPTTELVVSEPVTKAATHLAPVLGLGELCGPDTHGFLRLHRGPAFTRVRRAVSRVRRMYLFAGHEGGSQVSRAIGQLRKRQRVNTHVVPCVYSERAIRWGFA